MELKEILGLSGTGIIIVLMGLIKIKPLEISVWSFIARKMGKAFNGETLEKLGCIEKTLEKHIAEDERHKVEDSRRNILRFADEMYNHEYHSKEHFEDMLEQIDRYEDYCSKHKDFQNSKTVVSSRLIREKYEECLKNHSFD